MSMPMVLTTTASALCDMAMCSPFLCKVNYETIRARARARVMGCYDGCEMTLKSDRSAWRRKRKDRPLCGAKTRAGGTCLVRVEFGKARCRFHGGLSTGPKSEAGRARIAEAHRRRWRPYRERQADDVQAIRGTPMDGT